MIEFLNILKFIFIDLKKKNERKLKKYGICYARVPLVVVAAFIDCIKWFVFRLCVGKVEMCPNVAVVVAAGGVDVVDVRFVFWNIIVSNGSLLLRILLYAWSMIGLYGWIPHHTTLNYTIPLIHWLWKQILKYLKSPHAISVACLLLFSFSFLFDFFLRLPILCIRVFSSLFPHMSVLPIHWVSQSSVLYIFYSNF